MAAGSIGHLAFPVTCENIAVACDTVPHSWMVLRLGSEYLATAQLARMFSDPRTPSEPVFWTGGLRGRGAS